MEQCSSLPVRMMKSGLFNQIRMIFPQNFYRFYFPFFMVIHQSNGNGGTYFLNHTRTKKYKEEILHIPIYGISKQNPKVKKLNTHFPSAIILYARERLSYRIFYIYTVFLFED